MRQALELALEALEDYVEEYGPHEKDSGAAYAITAIKEALAQPEQPKVWTGDCLLVGVCASEGHKIQVKQEPWRESASDYERGVIDGRQMQAQSSVDKAVNRMAQPEQEPVVLQYPQKDIDWQREQQIKAQASIPPQRTWVGLTDEEIQECLKGLPTQTIDVYAKRIEAKLKEKNA